MQTKFRGSHKPQAGAVAVESMMLLLRVAVFLAVAFACWVANPAYAVPQDTPRTELVPPVELTTVYPPYPDVWVRQFPVLNTTVHDAPWLLLHPTGEVLVYYENWDVRKFEYFPFFSASFVTRNSLPYLENSNIRLKQRLQLGSSPLRLSNGDVIERSYQQSQFDLLIPEECQPPLFYGIRATNPNGRAIERVLIHVSDRPRPVSLPGGCRYRHYIDIGEMESRVASPLLLFAPLADGTILAAASKGGHGTRFPFVLRMRPDLTSPAIDERRLFLLSADDVRDFKDRAYERMAPSDRPQSRRSMGEMSREEIELVLERLRQFDADLIEFLMQKAGKAKSP